MSGPDAEAVPQRWWQTPGPTSAVLAFRVGIADETAVARVRDDYLGMTFHDSLSLLLADGRWQIYTKLFNVEGPAASGPQAAH